MSTLQRFSMAIEKPLLERLVEEEWQADEELDGQRLGIERVCGTA
jgi:hypothetical protein